MNWFRQNRFLGTFLAALALATLLSAWFLFHEKSAADEGQERLAATITELNRLRASSPFPNEENLNKTKAQTDSYRTSLQALEAELKTRMFPRPSLQPNEFQAQLRQAVIAVSERASASKVQLPENFNLGFDEYATSLPNSLAAPRLGRQLRAIEWLATTIIEAHVDSLNSLVRTPLPEEKVAPAATPPPGRARAASTPKATEENLKVVDAASVDITFSGSSAAVRKVSNQVTSAKDQFYIIRTLQVKNQADKGPKRGEPAAGAAVVPQAEPGKAGKAAEPGIIFIVGNERLNVAAKIEVVRFNVPEKGAR
ncbi:MAG: Amuc_1100 family pilus-like protein [Chthoniobacterales bacterium]